MKIYKSTDCKGQVLVIVALSIITLVTLVGLAIDSGRGYSVKAKLNAALDAAAIAAARSIADGTDEARASATTFFNSNYPTEYMGGSVPSFCPINANHPQDFADAIVTDPNTGDTTISVWATATMPTIFMKIVGRDSIAVAAETKATRRGVDLAFVVDNTQSLIGSEDDVKLSSIAFIGHFHENIDRVALIKYGFGGEVPITFESDRGFNKNDVNTAITAFNFNGFTNCSEGFWVGKHQIDTVNNPASLKVIVFFTDGAPNTFASTFEIVSNPLDYDDDHVGSIRTASNTAGTPYGFFQHYRVPPRPDSDGTYGSGIVNKLVKFPTYYNPCNANALDGDGNCRDPHTDNYGSPPSGGDCGCHDVDSTADPTDPDQNVFLVENPGHPRRSVHYVRTGNYYTDRDNLYLMAHRASRNLVEDMAQKARQQGIFVYTLGLGYRLTQGSGPDNEKGEDVLKRMANDSSADTFIPTEPEGIYCYAQDPDDLGPCYNKILEEIIRLTI